MRKLLRKTPDCRTSQVAHRPGHLACAQFYPFRRNYPFYAHNHNRCMLIDCLGIGSFWAFIWPKCGESIRNACGQWMPETNKAITDHIQTESVNIRCRCLCVARNARVRLRYKRIIIMSIITIYHQTCYACSFNFQANIWWIEQWSMLTISFSSVILQFLLILGIFHIRLRIRSIFRAIFTPSTILFAFSPCIAHLLRFISHPSSSFQRT